MLSSEKKEERGEYNVSLDPNAFSHLPLRQFPTCISYLLLCPCVQHHTLGFSGWLPISLKGSTLVRGDSIVVETGGCQVLTDKKQEHVVYPTWWVRQDTLG